MEQILKTLGSTFLSLKEFGFAYGIQGTLLRRNFEKFWFQKSITMSKYNVFYMPSNRITANLQDLNNIGLINMPFGIAEIDYVKNTWDKSIFPPKSKSLQHKIGKVTTLYESDNVILSVKDLFHKIQRERKSWWRSIVENPSIFYMSESKKKSASQEYVEIEAQFPFGNILVETIYFKKVPKGFIPEIENSANLRIIETITSFDYACLMLLCDGYTEIEGSKELQIHPKLSPFKAYCKANITAEDNEQVQQDLFDLTLYIVELLRERGVETVTMNYAKTPEVFRVPFIITVNSSSLITGLLKVVCQRTLCGETVHITNLAQHMYDRCVA